MTSNDIDREKSQSRFLRLQLPPKLHRSVSFPSPNKCQNSFSPHLPRSPRATSILSDSSHRSTLDLSRRQSGSSPLSGSNGLHKSVKGYFDLASPVPASPVQLPMDAILGSSVPEIPGYAPLVPIYPSYESNISMFRSVQELNDVPVLVKVSKSGTLEDLTRMRYEWSLTSLSSQFANNENIKFPSLDNMEGILRPDVCLRLGNTMVLSFPDTGLQTLREKFISKSAVKGKPSISASPVAIPKTSADMSKIIKLVIKALNTLGEAHRRKITHNGLTSSGIFVDDSGEVFVSDWDFSFSLKLEDPARGHRNPHLTQVGEYLSFVSPENTGIPNLLVDFRSDFYSIGCILYELLVGFPPFRSEDQSELFCMQVLRNPVAPSTVGTWIPEALSSIIMKLLEKNPDMRYQAINLVISDLELVGKRIELGEPIDEDFIPATVSRAMPIFLLSQTLYGRDAELTILKSCYNRPENKGFQFIFTMGEPGSGKTRLVNELERTSISRNSFFSVSKFDMYQRGAPFYSIVTVLKDIVNHILASSPLSINRWRENINTSIKVNVAVLFDQIPELKDLLGQEYAGLLPEPKRLNPVPRELRFKYVVKYLFCLFGEYGLTIFLDNIQWCPQTELALFRELATFAIENCSSQIHITFVCASTLEDTRSCQDLIRLSQDLGLHYEEVILGPLSYQAVESMVSDTLALRPTRKVTTKRASFSGSKPASELVDTQVSSLAHLLHGVTKGNPLFVNALLRHMRDMGYIYYENTNRLNGGKWKVNFETFVPDDIPKSAADTFIEGTKKLPAETIQIMKYAACICSNSFTLEDLAISANLSLSETAKALYASLDVQLLIPMTMHYKFPFSDLVGTPKSGLCNEEVRKVAAASTYRFCHDVIQQAVYSLLTEQEALETHRLIGLRLLNIDYSQTKSTSKVLEIANQLKNAVPIVREEDREIYIALNIQAGDKVYAMNDFDMAYCYFDTARILLLTEYLMTRKDLTQHIFLSLVELQYNRKNYTECLEMIQSALQWAESIVDRAALLRNKAKAENSLHQESLAISTGLEALGLLGFHFEEDESWNEENRIELMRRIPMETNEIRELVNLKSVTDPLIILAQEIIITMTVPLLLSRRPNLFRSLIYTSVVALLDHGIASSCSFSLLTLASLFQRMGNTDNLMRAYEYSKLAIFALGNDDGMDGDFGSNIYEYYALTLAIYFEPLSEVMRYFDVVLSSGQQFEYHSGVLSVS